VQVVAVAVLIQALPLEQHLAVAVRVEAHLQVLLVEPQTQVVVEAVVEKPRQIAGATAALVSLSSKSHLRTMPHSHLV